MIEQLTDTQVGISDLVQFNLQKHMKTSSEPIYIYDTEKIRYQCRTFMNIPYKLKSVHFATMANIHSEFLQIIRSEGLNVFVNSIEHLQKVHRAGFYGEEIVFYVFSVI